jgi:hypothetical protein
MWTPKKVHPKSKFRNFRGQTKDGNGRIGSNSLRGNLVPTLVRGLFGLLQGVTSVI